MLKKAIYKLKNINYIDLLKNLIKRVIINGMKMAVAYQISIFLLGYCVLTPILIRIFNITQTNNVAECWSLFELPSQQPTFSGLTWNELIIGGIVMGTAFCTLNVGINYLTENIYPPLLRSMGYDYYTNNELHRINLTKTDRIENRVNDLSSEVDNLTEALALGQQNTQNGILHAQQTIVALTTELYNRMGTIANNDIIPLKRKIDSLLIHLNSIESTIQNQAENALSPSALRCEMERLIALFNEEHNQVSNNIRRVLISLQEQVDCLEPGDLNDASQRLQSHISFLENVLRSHSESGIRVRDAVQTTLEEVAQQVELNQEQLITEPSNTLDSESVYSTINPDNVLSGSAASYASQQADIPTTRSGDSVETSSSTALVPAGTNSGSYLIEQKGDELIIRLSLKGNINIPVSEMSSNTALNQIPRMLTGALTDSAASGAITLVNTFGPRLLMGAFQGALTSVGLQPVFRSLINGPSNVSVAEEKIESGIEAAKTVGKAIVNVMLK